MTQQTMTFDQMGLPPPLVEAIARQGVTSPFPIQTLTITEVLAGRDVSAEAPTGSGKTLAFGLPLLAGVGRGERNRPRALILAPTRELAEQIATELGPLAGSIGRRVLTVYGGVGYGPQKSGLRRGVDVLVATPGRLEDLMAQGFADLSAVEIVVIDEADRMADMGFLPAVRRILDETSHHRQTLLFSATLEGDVGLLASRYQTDPVTHRVTSPRPMSSDAEHHFWLIDDHEKVERTARLVEQSPRAIVFTRTRHRADRLSKQLARMGVSTASIHGGRSQSQRTKALRAFSEGRALALVATDVAARGIHVDGVSAVIHFDLPADSTDYLHRSGRTARAGASGNVVAMVSAGQKGTASRIRRDLGLDGPFTAPGSLSHRPTGHVERTAEGDHGGDQVRTVFVKNLPWKATATDLETMFSRHGEVIESRIVTDGRGRSKGFGFVEMADDEARKAIAALHGTSLGGRPMTVLSARRQPAH